MRQPSLSRARVLAMIPNELPMGITAVDLAGRHVFANQFFCDMVGFSESQLLGATAPYPYWPAAHFDKIMAAFKEVLDGRSNPEGYLLHYARASGTVFPVRLRIAPMKDNGRVVGWMAAIADISRTVQQASDLAHSEMKFRAIAENIDEVFYVYDNSAGKIEYISPSYERIWDRSRQSVYAEARSFLDGILEPGRQQMLDYISGASRDEVHRIEYQLQRPDGTRRWIYDQSFPMQEAGKFWTVGIATDITERKTAELILRHRQSMLERAESLAKMAAWNVTLATNEVQTSDNLFLLLGMPVPTDHPMGGGHLMHISAMRDLLLQRTHPEDRAKVADHMDQLVDCEFRLELPGKGIRHILCHKQFVDDESGQPVSLLGVFHDVTEQRENSNAMMQLQKLEALGQLSGGLAHDLNNILAIVIGNLSELSPAASSSGETPVSAALNAALRGAELVNSLLSFARNRPSENRQSVELGRHLSELQHILNFVAGQRIRVELDLPAEPAWVQLDLATLDSSLINLLLNARDAMASGGSVRIACTLHAKDLRNPPAGVRPGPCVQLDMQDTGKGMDEHTLSHAMEPYFTTKRHGQGTGLGLSLVRGFVGQSGGAIQLKSAVGLGTCVSLYLPLVPPPAAEAKASNVAASAKRPAPPPCQSCWWTTRWPCSGWASASSGAAGIPSPAARTPPRRAP